MGEIPLKDIRNSYGQGELDEVRMASEPLQQFQDWLAEALKKKVHEPSAMTVATVGVDGRPSCRPVLIKEYDARGIVWYTNYLSRKGHDLAAHPFAALQFFWPELERVIRIEGVVEKVSAAESDNYFNSRPLTHRIGAWASQQSAVINNRADIVARAAEYSVRFGLHPPRPEYWGGYRLKPEYWEFWQGRSSRLHDRVAYRLQENGGWIRQRLSP